MKRKKIYSMMLFVLMTFFLTSAVIAQDESGCSSKSSSGTKTRTNSTKFVGKCSGCHNVGTPSETQTSWLTSNIPPTGYVPGTTYNIMVSPIHPNAANDNCGFALSCEDVATNNNKGTFTTPTSDIQQPAVGCVTHTTAGNVANAQGSRTWTVPWTAPAIGTGSVKFFSSLVTGNRGASTDFGWIATLSVSEAVVVSCPTALVITSTNTTCGASNGTVSIGAVTGGVAPYTYSFNGSGYTTTTNYTGLAAGTYIITVKDANACVYTTYVTITNTPGPTALIVTSTNVLCNGTATGTATASATGGTFPYTYLWSNGQATVTATGLVAGTYTVTIRDANNCSATSTATITQPTSITVSASSVNSTCGSSNGSATVIASGGIPPYTYVWINLQTTPTVINLAAGTYTVTVTDANGCNKTAITTVANVAGPSALAVTSTNSTNGASNGTVTIGAVTGGVAPYTYSFNGSAYGLITNFTGLFATSYPVNVQDANGCLYQTIVTVNNTVVAVIPTVTTYGSSSIMTTTATCTGSAQSDGGAAITAKGICYGTSFDPGLSGAFTNDGTGIGTFISNLSGLNLGTLYHFRAYATNSVGTAYGADMTFTTLTQTLGFTVSGNMNYNNIATNTTIANATVNLMNGTTLVASSTTNANGSFSFNNVVNSAYTITASTSLAWGGVTAIDILKMKRHIAGLEILTEPIRLTAADVNATSSINATDVLKVSRRIANLDASFTRPDWLFEMPTVGGNAITVNGANVSQNLYALCTGDVNGSYAHALVKSSVSVSFENNSIVKPNANETFELPVRISKANEIGAMQLFFNYPSDILEVVGVSMNSKGNDLLYNAKNGKLNIVWSSLESLKLNENDAIVTLTLKAVKNYEGTVIIDIQNENDTFSTSKCEIADALGNVINDLTLNSSTIELSSALNVDMNSNLNSISIYPNPSHSNVYVNLGKYSSKDVTVTICNSIGKQIAFINKSEMNNQFKFDLTGLSNGLYIVQIYTPDGKIVKSVSVNK